MKQWESMKMEYDRIEPPEELRGKLEGTIMRASEERKKKGAKWIIINTIKAVGLTAAAALIVFTVAANISPTMARAVDGIPVLGAFTRVVTFNRYVERNDNYEADIKIPQLEAGEDDTIKPGEGQINKSVKEYTDELLASFKKDQEDTGGDGHLAVASDYEVVTDNEYLFTLRINTVVAMGSSEQTAVFYSLDKTTDQVITLKDLFKEDADYVGVISESIKEQMREQMKADESKMYFLDSEEPTEEFKQIDGKNGFYLDENGVLTLVFDEYTVAPGYMGVVEFKIPKDVIGELLNETWAGRITK